MPPEAVAGARPALPRYAASPWGRVLITLAGVWLALIALFHDTWSAMVGQWWSSSTYSHILLVPAILAWLVAIRVDQVAKLTPRGWWPGLFGFAAAALVWLVGTVADLAVVSQAGAVAMLGASAITLLGPKVSAALAFPLGYMAFLVPMGDELVPTLQMVTAKLTVWLIGLSGIPAVVDGVFIDTPAGLFEVAEACSGVKFLIAMAALGVLAANLCFRSPVRRAAFLALALTLPILANGVRAWATIYVAQYVGAERATGFDHIVYGWIFFVLVIAAVLAISWRWFDRRADDPAIDASALAGSPLLTRLERRSIPTAAGAGLVIALALSVLAWAEAAYHVAAPMSERLEVPVVTGWTRSTPAPDANWSPRAGGAEARLLARYRNASGSEVDVFLAIYSGQAEGREAGAFGEGAIARDGGWAWLSPGPAMASARVERLLGPGRLSRLAATTYRTGDLLTGSNLRLKLAMTADRLRLKARPRLVLILSAEGKDAGEALRAFRTSAGPLGPWMDRASGLR
jgi:exosortase A